MNGIANEVINVIEVLAEKLGIAVEKVYPYLVDQADVFCSTYRITLWVAGIAALLAIVGLICIIISDHCFTSDSFDIVSFGLFVVAGIVMFFALLVAAIYCHEYFTALHNPEWWAIEYVTKLLK
jgi:hypothetical protein